MLKINKNIVKAINEFKVSNSSTSMISKKYSIDRHTLSKYKDFNFDNFILFEENYYKFDEKEEMAIHDYLENKFSLSEIKRKYGYKNETFKRKLEIINKKSNCNYKKKFNRDFFNMIDTEEKAYILGFILADGYINEEKNFLRIKVSNQDIDILEKICKALNLELKEIKTEFHNLTKNKMNYITLYGKDIIKNLNKYRLFQCKSLNEHPANISKELIRHYIRGIFDGDGWIDNSLEMLGFCSSKETLEFIKKHIDQNIQLSFNKGVSPYIKFDSGIYKLRYYGINIRKILDYMYKDSTIFLNRKYNKMLEELSKKRRIR